MNRNNQGRTKRVRYIINESIVGDQFRLIGEDGKQIDILSRQQALDYAREKGTDLVLIAPGSRPPVVKAIDIHKFEYQEQKKLKDGKKGAKKSQIKDVKITLFAHEADLNRLQKKAIEFLNEGHQVRLKLVLWGRQLGKREMAFTHINSFIKGVENAEVSSEPKFQGKVLSAVLIKKKNEKQIESEEISSSTV